MKSIQDMGASVKSAYLTAAGHVREATKRPIDPEVAYYESLKPDDLKAIESKYGLEEVGRYIKEMEARRRKVRR